MKWVIILLLIGTYGFAESIRIGVEGQTTVQVGSPDLSTAEVVDDAPVYLRIASVKPDESHDAIWNYDIRYIGMRTGRHDLTAFLLAKDGSATGLDPIPIEVVGVLPEDHRGDLETMRGLRLPGSPPIRKILIALGILWCLPLLWWLGRAIFRRRPAPAVEAPPPSLAEKLKPLVEAAAAGQLDTGGKAQLERMLLAHWRERLDLEHMETGPLLAHLRAHPDAGQLQRQLDRWLHEPLGVKDVDVAALLAPYRSTREGA